MNHVNINARIGEVYDRLFFMGRRNVLTEDEILQRIADAAIEAGSQRELAARLGVSPTYLSDILNGRRRPSEPFLTKFGYQRVYLAAE